MDVRPIGRSAWEFRYWVEPTPDMAWLDAQAWFNKCHWILNADPRSWGARTGIFFRRVTLLGECDIVIRFSNGPPPDWPDLVGNGWYYRDHQLGKNVAHVTARPEVFNNSAAFNYILGMEVVGHGTLRMWDMYDIIPEHVPYIGAMGGWVEAMLNDGWPTDTEIECAKAWLKGEAVNVHSHRFTVPDAAYTHEEGSIEGGIP